MLKSPHTWFVGNKLVAERHLIHQMWGFSVAKIMLFSESAKPVKLRFCNMPIIAILQAIDYPPIGLRSVCQTHPHPSRFQPLRGTITLGLVGSLIAIQKWPYLTIQPLLTIFTFLFTDLHFSKSACGISRHGHRWEIVFL